MRRLAILLQLLCLLTMLGIITPSSAQHSPIGQIINSSPAVPGELILTFKPEISRPTRQALVKAHGGDLIDHIPALNSETAFFPYLVEEKNSAATEALVTALLRQPSVLHIEPNLVYSTTTTPNDPQQASQWAWKTIQAYRAWDTTQGSAQIKIAIIDSGIQSTHPDLDAKLLPGYDFVDDDTMPEDGHGHGTHVAGSAAAETNNSTDGAGTCPNCRIIPVRVLDNAGSGTLSNVAKGIVFAADQGAQVLNLSLGGSGSRLLEVAVDYAWSRGAFLACAAGNEGTSSQNMACPAAYNNCYAVAATTSTDTRASFSNYGRWVEVAAPGTSITSTWLQSGFMASSGTSMATPHVAGLAGLLSAQGLTNAQIRERICATADPIAGTGDAWTCGRINAAAAVEQDSLTPAPNTTPTTDTASPISYPYLYVPIIITD